MIRRIGEALYGPRWKTNLADALGVSKKTIQDWCNGRMNPRPGVKADLKRIVAQRRAILVEIEDQIST